MLGPNRVVSVLKRWKLVSQQSQIGLILRVCVALSTSYFDIYFECQEISPGWKVLGPTVNSVMSHDILLLKRAPYVQKNIKSVRGHVKRGENVRCQGCRAEHSTRILTALVFLCKSPKACQDKICCQS